MNATGLTVGDALLTLTYARVLDHEVDDSNYRLAYDVAAEYLGVDALHHLPHIANLALMTIDPAAVIGPLFEGPTAGVKLGDHTQPRRSGPTWFRSSRCLTAATGRTGLGRQVYRSGSHR